VLINLASTIAIASWLLRINEISPLIYDALNFDLDASSSHDLLTYTYDSEKYSKSPA
jgi:hypothetical protein